MTDTILCNDSVITNRFCQCHSCDISRSWWQLPYPHVTWFPPMSLSWHWQILDAIQAGFIVSNLPVLQVWHWQILIHIGACLQCLFMAQNSPLSSMQQRWICHKIVWNLSCSFIWHGRILSWSVESKSCIMFLLLMHHLCSIYFAADNHVFPYKKCFRQTHIHCVCW